MFRRKNRWENIMELALFQRCENLFIKKYFIIMKYFLIRNFWWFCIEKIALRYYSQGCLCLVGKFMKGVCMVKGIHTSIHFYLKIIVAFTRDTIHDWEMKKSLHNGGHICTLITHSSEAFVCLNYKLLIAKLHGRM